MTARARRDKRPDARTPLGKLGDKGAERYMWVFPEEHHVVLTIPGIRDLKLTAHEARAIGEMLIQTADELTNNHSSNHGEGGDNHGSAEEPPVAGGV
ncbi:MAG: hypothetical protein JO364_09730 [Pseudonocardiales bacterium]|nr:hypothetical protein [Pseudonocardiales bacterium]